MASRVRPVAAPGSLLKAERKPKEKRQHAPDYLTLVRRCPCLACDADPAGEAAHLRMTIEGKPMAGIGNKPDDRWVLPLCHNCHTDQHTLGEATFWGIWNLGLNPFEAASDLYYSRDGGIEKMRAAIFAAREQRK